MCKSLGPLLLLKMDSLFHRYTKPGAKDTNLLQPGVSKRAYNNLHKNKKKSLCPSA